MAIFDGLDAYCERTDPSAWAEPLNVLSCLAFFVAVAWLLQRAYPVEARRVVRQQAVMLTLVGITSAYSHLEATVLASWVDAGMILAFIVVFVFQFMTRVMRAGGMAAMGAILGLVMVTRMVGVLSHLPLNGSQIYVAPWLMLGGFAWASRHIAADASRRMALATLVFGVAIMVRALDMPLCDYFSLGTHFIWHLLNAVVLYLCVRGLAEGCHERSGW